MKGCIANRPSCPSLEGGALTHSQALALSKRARDVTALRCSEPLRSKVGGPIKGLAMLCGIGPPDDESLVTVFKRIMNIFNLLKAQKVNL